MQDLGGKIIAVDAFNWIFQFLTTIRLADGSFLTDKNGKVTTHLNGIFYRTINLLTNNITPCFVFDGEPPKFKKETVKQRKEVKEEAIKMAESAKTEEERAMYLRRATSIDDYIIESSKKLLYLMGVPYIQAPAEGEAQAASIVKSGLAYAVASQDYDTLLFGGIRLVRNLNIANKRKLPGRNIKVNVYPEFIDSFDKDRVISNLNKINTKQNSLFDYGE